MIIGSFSLSGYINDASSISAIRELISAEAVFHPVIHDGFSGGFYLHPRLPYTSCDSYYYDEGNAVIVLLSGVIYNRNELLDYLNLPDSNTTPELIYRLFSALGSHFVNRLNGDFAIFIGQPKKNLAFLFRDHVGIKPVFWRSDNSQLIFSSELNNICKIFSQGEIDNIDYLMGYFKFIDYKNTTTKNVNRLLPGHWLEFTKNGTELKKYWHPELVTEDRNLEYKQMMSDLSILLDDAVRIRCDKRFTAGVHISGGIDSSYIAALVKREYSWQEELHGFSWSPLDYTSSGLKFDERELVNKLCKELNISPHFADMKIDDFRKILSRFYFNHGFFSEDHVIGQASKYPVNLIFSGWGGDEFVSTGDRGIELDLLRGMKLKIFFRRNPLRPFKKFIRNQLRFVIYPAFGILDKDTSDSFRDEARYIRKSYGRRDRKAIRNFYFHTSRHQLHLRLLNFYHLQDRCEHWSINGFSKGIEYRYPLLDKRLIEFMLKVPSWLLCRNDYYRPLLREVSKDLLPDVVRLNWEKSDPVYWSWIEGFFRESAILFMDEVKEWKNNQDMYFVNFELLDQDIESFKAGNIATSEKTLFRFLVYLKAVNEFCLEYHKKW